jgi:hypothetical protein
MRPEPGVLGGSVSDGDLHSDSACPCAGAVCRQLARAHTGAQYESLTELR